MQHCLCFAVFIIAPAAFPGCRHVAAGLLSTSYRITHCAGPVALPNNYTIMLLEMSRGGPAC